MSTPGAPADSKRALVALDGDRLDPVASADELSARDLQHAKLERGLSRLRALALLMDDRFELPVVKVRFGLDPIIGLIPGWGDWVTWAISAYILLEGIRMGVPARKLVVMATHAGVDLVTGYVPGIGDLIDVAYKANRRNVNIVLTHFGAEPIAFGKDAKKGRADAPDPTASDAAARTDAAADDDVALVKLPADALDRRVSSASRWVIGGGALILLAALAALPILLISWLLQR